MATDESAKLVCKILLKTVAYAQKDLEVVRHQLRKKIKTKI